MNRTRDARQGSHGGVPSRGNVLQGRSLAGTLSLRHARAWGMRGPGACAGLGHARALRSGSGARHANVVEMKQ
jgi:hypothetical protein